MNEIKKVGVCNKFYRLATIYIIRGKYEVKVYKILWNGKENYAISLNAKEKLTLMREPKGIDMKLAKMPIVFYIFIIYLEEYEWKTKKVECIGRKFLLIRQYIYTITLNCEQSVTKRFQLCFYWKIFDNKR